MTILSRITRTTITTETVEDTTPDFPVRTSTPDADFSAPSFPDYSDSAYADDFDETFPDWEDELLDGLTEGLAQVEESAPLALTVAVQVDGRPSGTFTYPSIERFARAVESYSSYYSSAGEVTLTIRKS